MYRLSLLILSIIGVWYGLPGMWAGSTQIIHEKFTMGEYHPQWNHLLTVWVVICTLKVKGKK